MTERFGKTNGYTKKSTYKAAWAKLKKSGWSSTWPRGSKGEYTILSAIRDSMDYDESLVDYASEFQNKLGMHVDHWEAKRGRTKREAMDLLKDM